MEKNYKNDKLITIVQEFKKEGNKYQINGIDTSTAVFFGRIPQGQYIPIPKGNYTITTEENIQYLNITNDEYLATIESIQVGVEFATVSSEYNVEFNVDINILKDKYNVLVGDVKNLFEYVRKTLMISDGLDVDVVLPQLDVDEVWVKTENGYRGFNIGSLESNVRRMIEELRQFGTTLKKELNDLSNKLKLDISGAFDKEIQAGKESITQAGNTEVGIITDLADDKKIEITTHTDEEIKRITATGIDNKFDKGGVLEDDYNTALKVQNKLKTTLMTIDTIEVLKATNLKQGDVVEVLGYYFKDDGATHKRLISSTDDGSGVQLSNGLYANIVHNGEVNVSWFGAKGNGIEDDTQAIQKALNYSFNFKYSLTTKFNSGTYLTNKSLKVKRKKSQEGGFWFRNANVLTGENAQNTFIVKNKTDDSLEEIDSVIYDNETVETASGYSIENITFINKSQSADSYCMYFKNYANSIIRNFNCANKNGKGIHCGGNSFSNIFDNLRIFTKEKALWVYDNATSNNFKNIYTSGCSNPYRIGGVYSVIDNVYGDNCLGEIFRIFGNVTVVSIGTESQNADKIVVADYQSNIIINSIYLFGLSKETGVVFYSEGNLDSITVLSCKIDDTNSTPNKYLLYSSPNFEQNNLTFTFNQSFPKMCKPLGVNKNKFTRISIDGRNYNKGSKVESILQSSDANKIGVSISTNHLTHFYDVMRMDGQTDSLRYTAGNNIGDIMLSKTPDKANCLGWVTMKQLSEIGTNYDNYARIPILLNYKPNENLFVGLQVFDKTTKKPIWWNGSNWIFADGSTQQVQLLDTPYYATKMKQENVYDDFVSYMDEKILYDKKQEQLEKDKQLAYEEELVNNPNLTYDEFIQNETEVDRMMLLEMKEPKPSQALQKFIDKWL